jgi:hypothetical protein
MAILIALVGLALSVAGLFWVHWLAIPLGLSVIMNAFSLWYCTDIDRRLQGVARIIDGNTASFGERIADLENR